MLTSVIGTAQSHLPLACVERNGLNCSTAIQNSCGIKASSRPTASEPSKWLMLLRESRFDPLREKQPVSKNPTDDSTGQADNSRTDGASSMPFRQNSRPDV